jgi:hypothetical protein
MFNHIQYNKWNNNIEKTCGCKSLYYCKNVEEEVKNPLKRKVKKQPTKKNSNGHL